MSELTDEINDSHPRHGVRADASIPDPLSHLNGHSPHPDPVGYREENCDEIVEFDQPMHWVGHDCGLRHFFRRA